MVNENKLIYRLMEKTSISFTVKSYSPVKTLSPPIPVSFTYAPPRVV
jgi:hypothetical protein